jgi:phosphoribosylamine--glycine ligase
MSGLKVLVVGSGGREHALGWALARSASVARVEAAPGNPGLAEVGPLRPEIPRAGGLADRLRAGGTAVFGPGAAGARLEASKAFAKDFMARHGIPTARFRTVKTLADAERTLAEWGAPIVIKASGLAAGKGVTVAETADEARAAARAALEGLAFGAAGSEVVLEERLTGEEASVFVITDGRNRRVLPGSRDHKRAFDGDRGPNTGGMGAVSPAAILTPAMLETVERSMIEPTLEGFHREKIAFRGLLYFGIMVTAEGPRLLEYNVRFGDPETQAVLPRLGGDLGEVLLAAARGELAEASLLEPAHPASACVVAAAADYPRSGARGLEITGLERARERGALVFHAGTAVREGKLVTWGGRVLNVVGVGDTPDEALEVAYAGIGEIGFEGMRYRTDIGGRPLRTAERAGTPNQEGN